MSSALSWLAIISLAFACVSCGVKGPPLPPEDQKQDVSTAAKKTPR